MTRRRCERRSRRGLAADVLVTSGGVSVGEHDLVRAVERELGLEEVFWRVSIKPGKPVSFGVMPEVGTLVFGLPGNPVSALVGCELFVKPAVRALQGLADPLPRFEPGRLAIGLGRNEERDEFVRARSRVERRRAARARADHRPGVAHDRPLVRRGRARPHSTWKRRACGRFDGALAPPRYSLTGRCVLATAARRRGAKTSVRMSSRTGPRRGRSPGAGYGA